MRIEHKSEYAVAYGQNVEIDRESLGMAHLLELPVRIRVGEFKAFGPWDSGRIRIYVVNPGSIGAGGCSGKELSEARSRVIVTCSGCFDKVTYDKVVNLATGNLADSGVFAAEDAVREQRGVAHRAFNRFLTSYRLVAGRSLVPSDPTTPAPYKLFQFVYRELFLVAGKECSLTHAECRELLDWKPPYSGSVSVQIIGPNSDLSNEELNRIEEGVNRLGERPFVEFDLLSHDLWNAGEAIPSFLMKVVGLECAHAELVGLWMASSFPDGATRKELLKEYLPRIGTTMSLKITCYTLIDDRPTESEVDACIKAFEKRNAVMHGKTARNHGRPQMVDWSEREISTWIDAVDVVYRKLTKQVSTQCQAGNRSRSVKIDKGG